MLRATGVNLDLRKAEPYGIYDRFEFQPLWGIVSDVFDRYMIRILEMRESGSILRQAIGDIPQGDFIHPKAKPQGVQPPPVKPMDASRHPRANWAFTSSAMVAPSPIVSGCVLQASSI